MKLKYVYLTLGVLAILSIGSGATWLALESHYEEKFASYKEITEDFQNKINNICGGYDLGGVRLTEITCSPGNKELCICGDPANLMALRAK
jgi:hypothetical protein|tara:strand:+ start:537 stop:809 length:273 start_codon:yes stop_codon:yes gene_type:complete